MLAAMILLNIGSLAISAFIVQGRLESISTLINEQTSRIQNQSKLEQEMVSAHEMLEIRSQRIDWAPKLALLSEKLDKNLQIDGFEGSTDRGKIPRKFMITGQSCNKDIQISVFTQLVEILRVDPRISNDFSNLKLGSVGGGSGTQFQIIGESQKGGS
jgi:hypothetical protein